MMFASTSVGSLPGDLLTNILLRLPLTYTLSRLLRGNSSSLAKSLSQYIRFPSLPEELLSDILLRLPVKSLLRCKAVCKEWHSIISSSSFVNMHFNHQDNLTRLVLYCNGGTPEQILHFYFTYSYFTDHTTLQKHDVPDNLLLWGEITYFSGPCNGIYCIYVTNNKFALWNPTTRRVRFIQCCPSHIFDEFGFGMDPVIGDFKIVLIRSRYGVSPCFAVYTSGSDSWKYLEQESLYDPSGYVTDYLSILKNAYYNGFYYWIKNIGNYYTLLAYDMHNEIFEETIMPETVGSEINLNLLNNSLALVSFEPSYVESPMNIWLMEGKGRWSKFFTVVLPFQCNWSYGFWGTEILMQTRLDNVVNLVVYDLDSHTARQIKVENAHDYAEILPIFYKESLFSLKDNDGIQDYDIRSAEALEFLGCKGPRSKFSCYDFHGDVVPLWLHVTYDGLTSDIE